MSRPSDKMTLSELRDEFDWMFEFQSRMAEQIRGDADVHNLADYVSKLEVENVRLRELMYDRAHVYAIQHMTEDELRITLTNVMEENRKLRELVHWMYDRMDESCAVQHPYAPTPINYDQLMQAQARACELGVVDG